MQDPPLDSPKKRQRRKAARPEEIISAAMALWNERGFAATRLEDVAAGAGVAKGTIYRYFVSKEALFEAALHDRLVAMVERASERARGFDGMTAEMLTGFFDVVRVELVEGGASIFLRVLLAEGHRFPGLVAHFEAVALSRGMAAVRAILASGVARGDLRPEALNCDPRLIMAPAIMLALWQGTFRNSGLPDMADTLAQHVAILVAGLGQPAG